MSGSDWPGLLVLAFLWLGYFVLHSVLASLAVKRWVASRYPERMPLYRLGFNCLALLTLLPILWVTFRYRGPPLWVWRGFGAWLSNGLALVAVFAFIKSLKYYDSAEFLGLGQWRSGTRRVEDQESFHLSPFHRYVRHPWYFFCLVLIWTRDMDAATLVSASMMTLYFIAGSRLEERKLVCYHGDVYRRYMARVPGLIPWPGKSLSAEQATDLVKAAAAGRVAEPPLR